MNSSTVRHSSFAALRFRDFRLLWIGQFISITGSQMQLVAINWHVYLLTRSALALGLVGLVRVLPIILCSLIGGVVADVVDRRHMIVSTQTVMLICAAVLSFVTWSGIEHVWVIYALTAIASAAVAFDNPARQALLPSLVPAEHFPNAVSLGLIVFQIATVMGPLLAGLLLSLYGPAVIYAFNAVSFIAVIVSVLMMRASGRVESGADEITRVSFAALRDGLRFVWRTPIIVQTMTLDFIATFFASATALLPIFAAEVLHVGARGLGFLAASPAAGAVVTGLLMTRFNALRRQGAIVIGAVVIYGAATVAFGLSRVFWLSALMLAIVGGADTVSTVLRQTIRQLATPNHLRGRMTSVNMIFFMGGPQLGEMEAGAVAAVVGAPLSVVSGGLACIAAVFFTVWKARSLWNYRSDLDARPLDGLHDEESELSAVHKTAQ